MHSFASIVALALAAAAFAAPTSPLPIIQSAGATPGKYMVKLRGDVHITQLPHTLSGVTAVWDIVNGFAATLSDAELSALRASPDVEAIYEDGTAYALGTQNNAPWGLQRIDQPGKLSTQNAAGLTYNYTWNNAAGTGVDVYVIDTGIYTAHSEFGGRARWGTTFGGYANADGNGHGTHCSGTIGGSRYGVAKNVSLIAVKVLSDGGSGSWSDVVSGINWVASQAASTKKPSLVSMSLGGGATQIVDDAIKALTTGGVHAVVAAGNSADDASFYSPARAPSAITVGAVDITDTIAYFSNYGSVVDIFAPGVDVISSWIGSTTATNSISGTSMATPHVAGTLALLISVEGNGPAATLEARIKTLGSKGILSSIPSGTTNNLAQTV